MNLIESVLKRMIPTFFPSCKPFRMKGGEVERAKGIEPSMH